MKKTLLKSVQLLLILSFFFAVGCKKDVPVIGVALDKDNITLSVGETEILKETVYPEDATNKVVSWTSTNPIVATVAHGKITATKVGTAGIVATTEDGNYMAMCILTVVSIDSGGVVINGVKWAGRNVAAPGRFAAKPEDPGMFYQWNRKVGWSVTDPMINSDGGTTWDSFDATGTTWERANDPCPPGWRVPTSYELQSLVNTGSQWTILNGINGCIFGRDDNLLFFPAVGNRNAAAGRLDDVGESGSYWSGTLLYSSNAYDLYFSSWIVSAYGTHGSRSCAFSVRCVSE